MNKKETSRSKGRNRSRSCSRRRCRKGEGKKAKKKRGGGRGGGGGCGQHDASLARRDTRYSCDIISSKGPIVPLIWRDGAGCGTMMAAQSLVNILRVEVLCYERVCEDVWEDFAPQVLLQETTLETTTSENPVTRGF